MPITFSCSSCQQEVTVADAYAGQRGSCPRCRAPIVAPASPALVAPTVIEAPASRPPVRTTRPSARLAPMILIEIEQARSDPKKRFGRFLILGELGRGGMGAVYRAWDDKLQRVVAIKVVLENANKAAIARFEREAEAVARLKHPNVVSVHDTGEADGRHYLVMDLIEGKTLKRALNPDAGEARIPLTRALEVVRDVARAVQYAHEQGVIHRDLKPENILIDERGSPHVLDFGLASLSGSSGGTLTRSGTALGTPAYMPPEQTGGDEPVNERSDVWSLGATLYHVLTGRPPFEGSSELNIIAAVVAKDPAPPSASNPRVSRDLETICLRCLEKSSAKRYPSAGDLAAELDRYLSGDPIEARPPGRSERLVRSVKRHKAGTAIAVLAVSLVVTLAASAIRARTERSRAEAAKAAEQLAADRAAAARARSAFDLALSGKLGVEHVVATGIDALAATSRLAEVDDDPGARQRAFDTAIEFGDAAKEREQWELASAGYRRAEGFNIANDRVAEKLAVLERKRTARSRERSAAVERVLAVVSEGRVGELGGTQGAVLEIVHDPGPETVALIARALDAVTATLRKARRQVLLESGVANVEGAVDALDRLELGATLPEDLASLLERARVEREQREKREKTTLARGMQLVARSFTAIVDDAQTAALGAPGVAMAEVACDALGWLPSDPVALAALERYALAEANQRRSATAAIALLRLESERGAHVVASLRKKFGSESAFSDRVNPFLEKSAPASQDEPRNAVAFNARGVARRNAHDIEGALADFGRAIELDPSQIASWINRGDTRREKGDFQGARSDLDRALAIDSTDASALTARAAVRLAQGDVDGAFTDVASALERGPRARTLEVRGALKLERKDRDGALADFLQAFELDPRAASAIRNAGFVRREKGDFEGAIVAFTKAIEADPRDAQAFTLRGSLRRARGDLAGALSDQDRSIELDDKDPRAWHNRANVRAALGDQGGAFLDYDRSIELDPRSPTTFIDRAGLRQAVGDIPGALSDCEQAIALDPREPNAYVQRGTLRAASHDLEGAIADATKAIELDPKNGRAHNNRGNARCARQPPDLDGAIADYTKALELEPMLASSFLLARASARHAKGDDDAAIADLTKAIEHDERYAKAYANRGLLLSTRGESAKAIADLSRYLELAPDSSDAKRIRETLERLRGG